MCLRTVEGPTGRSWMGRRNIGGPAEKSWTGQGTLEGGPGWVEGPSWRSGMSRVPSLRSGTSRETLDEVRNESRKPRGGPGGVEGPLRMFGTGRGTLEEVWDWS